MICFYVPSSIDRLIVYQLTLLAASTDRQAPPAQVDAQRSTQRLKHDSRTLSALTPKQRTYVGARAQFQRTQHTESTVPHSNALRTYHTITHTHTHTHVERHTDTAGEAILYSHPT